MGGGPQGGRTITISAPLAAASKSQGRLAGRCRLGRPPPSRQAVSPQPEEENPSAASSIVFQAGFWSLAAPPAHSNAPGASPLPTRAGGGPLDRSAALRLARGAARGLKSHFSAISAARAGAPRHRAAPAAIRMCPTAFSDLGRVELAHKRALYTPICRRDVGPQIGPFGTREAAVHRDGGPAGQSNGCSPSAELAWRALLSPRLGVLIASAARDGVAAQPSSSLRQAGARVAPPAAAPTKPHNIFRGWVRKTKVTRNP